MNERQLDLIMQIVHEQLADFVTEELENLIAEGIAEGLQDNQQLMERKLLGDKRSQCGEGGNSLEERSMNNGH